MIAILFCVLKRARVRSEVPEQRELQNIFTLKNTLQPTKVQLSYVHPTKRKILCK